VACARCPYTSRYTVLWRDATNPQLKCVMLRCCSGPELRILDGETVVRSELYKTPDAVQARAEELRGQPVEALAQTP
jgi:hypothetical protein